MITIDEKSLYSTKGESYIAGGTRVKALLDGVDISSSCIYCNVDLGFAVVHKKTLDGNTMRIDNDIVYEVLFGNIEVTPL